MQVKTIGFLVAVALGHVGCPMAPVVQRTTNADWPCAGTPKTIYEACGCHPRDDAFITRVSVLGLADIVKDAAKNCANGDLSLNVSTKQIVQTSVKACIEQTQAIDEASRKTLLESLKVAETEAANKSQESEMWRGCYKKKAEL